MLRRNNQRTTKWLVVTLVIITLLPDLAFAAPMITEYLIPSLGGAATEMTVGPDGALWFTELNGNQIGRSTLSGSITEFAVPTPASSPWGITSGPDGALWFTEHDGDKIGRMTTAGVVTEFTIPTPGSAPTDITLGPDGALWFGEQLTNKIGRITTAGVFTEFSTPTAVSQPLGITSGPDGNIWFTEEAGNNVGRITPAGVITEFPLTTPSQPATITAGPDGAMWFTEQAGVRIGRITLSGAVSGFTVPTPGSAPFGITAGPDGALWFTERNVAKIGRMTLTGHFSEFDVPTQMSIPVNITKAPDDSLWFTEQDGDRIARIDIPQPSSGSSNSGNNNNTSAVAACNLSDHQATTSVYADVPPTLSGDNMSVNLCYGILTDPVQIGVNNQPIILAVEIVAYSQTDGASVTRFNQPVKVCLKGSGTLLYRDATGMPRVLTTLVSDSEDGFTCGDIPNAGTVILVAGAPGPAADATVVADAHPLQGCSVTVNDILNLHAGADVGSAVLALIPYNTVLQAEARDGEWLKVIYGSQSGWLLDHYLSLDGNCS